MTRYRICVVSSMLPPAFGGAEIAAWRYAERVFRWEDGDVLLVGWDRSGRFCEWEDPPSYVRAVRMPEAPQGDGLRRQWRDLGYYRRCIGALRSVMRPERDRFDIVHVFNSGMEFSLSAIATARLLGKKILTETSLIGSDDPVALGRVRTWKDRIKTRRLKNTFFRMADMYVSKSAVITAKYVDAGIDLRRVAEIPYAVDVEEFQPATPLERAGLRMRFGIPQDAVVILFIGGINARKGVLHLVEAFDRIAPRHPDAWLVVAGPTYKYDSTYVNEVRDRMMKSPWKDRAIFRGERIERVADYMRCSDLFAFPTRREGLPIAVLEAMSCALAVVASDIPEIARAEITDPALGRLFPYGDVTALAKTLEELLDDPALRESIGRAARRRILESFSTEEVDRRYREAYEELLSGSRGSRG